MGTIYYKDRREEGRPMYITVTDALKLPAFQNAQVVAGSGGLDRRIYRVSVAECPEFPIDVDIAGKTNQLFEDGDFFISSFYAVKDKPEMLLDTIKLYNRFNSSGVAISRKYFEELPREVISYANEANYPLIMIDKTMAYANAISDVMKAIFAQQNNYTSILLIDQILNNNYSEEKLERLAYTLNPKFNNYLVTFYIQCLNQIGDKINLLVSIINSCPSLFAINYYNSIIVFVTTEHRPKNSEIECFKKSILQMITKYYTKYYMGISHRHDGLSNIKMSIEQAMIACKVSHIDDSKIESYEKIGTYKLLLEVKNRSVLKKYYDELVLPIRQYDQDKKGELLSTMIAFAKNDGDIKKTAQNLFQHENTIRYRLGKVKKLLNADDDNLKFFENLAVTYKVYKILSNDEG